VPTVKVEYKFPKKKYAVHVQRFIAGAKRAVDRTVHAIEKDLRATTRSWSRPVKFVKKKARRKRGDIVGSLSTKDKRFVMLDLGTPAHFVPSKGKARMKVKTYKAKTRVGKLSSRKGGVSKVAWRTGRWKVKGIKPRKFLATAAKKHRKTLRREAQAALKRAMK